MMPPQYQTQAFPGPNLGFPPEMPQFQRHSPPRFSPQNQLHSFHFNAPGFNEQHSLNHPALRAQFHPIAQPSPQDMFQPQPDPEGHNRFGSGRFQLAPNPQNQLLHHQPAAQQQQIFEQPPGQYFNDTMPLNTANIYQPEVVILTPQQDPRFVRQASPVVNEQGSPTYMKPVTRNSAANYLGLRHATRPSHQDAAQMQTGNRMGWVDLGINHPTAAPPQQFHDQIMPQIQPYENIYAQGAAPSLEREASRERGLLSPHYPEQRLGSSREVSRPEFAAEPAYFSSGVQIAERSQFEPNTFNFKSSRSSAGVEQRSGPIKSTEPERQRPTPSHSQQPSQRFVKVTRYSRNADGGKTLLSEGYEPEFAYQVVVEPSSALNYTSNPVEQFSHHQRRVSHHDGIQSPKSELTDIYSKTQNHYSQKETSVSQQNQEPRLPENVPVLRKTSTWDSERTQGISERVVPISGNIQKFSNGGVNSPGGQGERGFRDPARSETELDLYNPKRASAPRVDQRGPHDGSAPQGSTPKQIARNDFASPPTFKTTMENLSNPYESQRAMSSQTFANQNGYNSPTGVVESRNPLVSIPAPQIRPSAQDIAIRGSPNSQRMNSPSLAAAHSPHSNTANRQNGPVVVEMDYKASKFNFKSPDGVDQSLFDSLSQSKLDRLGNLREPDAVGSRNTPNNQRPGYSSAPRKSPVSTGDQYSLSQLKSSLNQTAPKQSLDLDQGSSKGIAPSNGYVSPIGPQSQRATPLMAHQSPIQVPPTRGGPPRPFASFDLQSNQRNAIAPNNGSGSQPNQLTASTASKPAFAPRAPPQAEEQEDIGALVVERPSPPKISAAESRLNGSSQERHLLQNGPNEAKSAVRAQSNPQNLKTATQPAPQLPPNPAQKTQAGGPMAERDLMFRNSPTQLQPLAKPAKNPADQEIEDALKYGQKRTRESAKADFKDIKEPFLEEISSTISNVQGPFKDKRTRTSARDSHDAKVKLIKERRNAELGGSAQSFPQIVEPVAPAPKQPEAKPAAAEVDKTVQIVYKEINGKRYPVKIDSKVLSETEKHYLLKQLLDKEGLSAEDVRLLTQANEEPEVPLKITENRAGEGIRSPGAAQEAVIPVVNLSEKPLSPPIKQGSLEFSVTPQAIIPDKKFVATASNLVMNIQNEIIDEQDEEANSKSSRRESVGVENMEALEREHPFDDPPSVVKKKAANFKKQSPIAFNLPEIPPFNKSKSPAVAPEEDLDTLLKRNEELMKLLGDEFGDLENLDSPKQPRIVKESRGLRNNLSEKYNSGQFSHLAAKDEDKFSQHLSQVPTLENDSLYVSGSLLSPPHKPTN